MNITQLEYIVTIANEGSVVAAAEKLYVTQPSISIMVKKLEDELGVEIFARRHRQLSITPAGEQVLAQAKIILKEVDILYEVAKRAKKGIKAPARTNIMTKLPEVKKELAKHKKEFEKKLSEMKKLTAELEQMKAGLDVAFG